MRGGAKYDKDGKLLTGRKNSGETETKSFRIHKEWLDKAREKYGRGLNRLVDDFIKSLSNGK